MSPEQERVRNLLADAVTLLCKKGLTYHDELRIEALIGITLDKSDVLLVHINEKFEGVDKIRGNSSPSGSLEHESLISTPKNLEQIDSLSKGVTFRTQIDSSDNSLLSCGVVSVASQNVNNHAGHHNRDITLSGRLPGPETLIKIEHKRIKEDEEIAEQPDKRLKNLDSIACQAVMVAGRRRGPGKRPYSETTQFENSGCFELQWGHFDEPSRKRTIGCKDDTTYGTQLSVGMSERPGWYSNIGNCALRAAEVSLSAATNGQTVSENTSWSFSQVKAVQYEGLTASQAEAKYPSHALQSHNVKEVLVKGIVDTALRTGSPLNVKVMSFRMSWFSGHVEQLEHIWQNIVAFQQQVDSLVTGTAGSRMVVSAFTGTLSGRTTKTACPGLRMTYPGLAYWIVSQGDSFNERNLMCSLQGSGLGARIKPLLQDYEQTQGKIANALFVVMKDCMGGYVRRKVDESLSVCTEDSVAQQSLVRMYVKDDEDFQNILMVQARLKSVGCDVSLHKL